MERTFIMLKPDAIERNLIGEIISRFEKKGFILSQIKKVIPERRTIEQHYIEHVDKVYFHNLINFIHGQSVIVMIWEGINIIEESRKMIGATNPSDRYPGTIRGDLSNDIRRNLIHGSDCKESAEREISIWF